MRLFNQFCFLYSITFFINYCQEAPLITLSLEEFQEISKQKNEASYIYFGNDFNKNLSSLNDLQVVNGLMLAHNLNPNHDLANLRTIITYIYTGRMSAPVKTFQHALNEAVLLINTHGKCLSTNEINQIVAMINLYSEKLAYTINQSTNS